MPAVGHCSRIDTLELKLDMERRLGSQKAQKYFNLLTRYLSLKLTKPAFDKLCLSLLGKQNLPLHNQLIKSILKNATLSKPPSPKQVNSFSQPCSKNTATELFSLGSKPPNSVEDGEEVEQSRTTPVTAPFGINIHSKESRKILLSPSLHTNTCHYNSQLPPTTCLSNRLKQKLKTEGLDLDISMDCVNLLNNGLDCFLKRIIKPSLELARSRSVNNPKRLFSVSSSMVDLRVMTETNPKILGQDWGVKFEFETRKSFY